MLRVLRIGLVLALIAIVALASGFGARDAELPGPVRSAKALAAGLQPTMISNSAATPFATPSSEQLPSAAMSQGNAARTGEMPGPAPDGPVAEKWRFKTHGAGFSFGTPVVEDGTLFVVSGNGELHALDVTSGQELWTFPGLYLISRIAVADGVVYGGGGRDLFAVDASSGQLLWRVKVYGDLLQGQLPSISPFAVGGVVIVNNDQLDLIAYDAKTGEQRWVIEIGGYATIITAPEATDVIYASTYLQTIYAIDPASGETRWTTSLDNTVNYSPMFEDGVLYATDSSNAIYAIDGITGRQRWKIPGNDQVRPNLLAVRDGSVLLGDSNNYFVAIDAVTGSERWRTWADGAYPSSAVIAGNVVYAATGNYNLFGFDLATGDTLWSIQQGQLINWQALTESNGSVYARGIDGDINLIDPATGEPIWQYWVGSWSVPAEYGTAPQPIVVNGVIYAIDMDGVLYALNADAGYGIWQFSAGGGIQGAPAVSGGVAYFGSYDGLLYAVDIETGRELWSIPVANSISITPAIADGVVFVTSGDGYLNAIDISTTGYRWYFDVGGYGGSSPTVVDGVVYVAGDEGTLYAIDAVSGQEIWSYYVSDSGISAPAVSNGVAVVSTSNMQLVAIDAVSGYLRWSTYASENYGQYSPAISNGVVIAGDNFGQLQGLDVLTGSGWSSGSLIATNFAPAYVDHVIYYINDVGTINADNDPNSDFFNWQFSLPNVTFSSLVVAGDQIVAVGHDVQTYVQRLYGIDRTTGYQLWVQDLPGYSATSPVVLDGVVYIGNGDGSLYAYDTPPLETQIAIADAAMTATAAAESAANASANATATAEARELAWTNYLWGLGTWMSESPDLPPGLAVGDLVAPDDLGLSLLPTGWVRGAAFPVASIAGDVESQVSLLIFSSKAEADSAVAAMTGGLTRSGWVQQEIDGLAHDHICLSYVRDEAAQAVCYMTRDNALIVSSSALPVNAPDAALLNARDLAALMDAAYDRVRRPSD